MKNNFRTKVQKLPNGSLGTLSKRIADTVQKTAIEQAKNSKQYLLLSQVNAEYQALLTPKSQKEISEAVKQSFENRQQLYKTVYTYTNGLLNSPDDETKQAAVQVFRILNAFGTNFNRLKVAEQTIRYIRIIEMLQSTDMTAAIQKLQLSGLVTQLDAAQREYENLYTGRGDERLGFTFASALRKKLIDAIVEHYEECCWLAKQNDTAEWKLLVATIDKRVSEVSTKRTSSTTESIEVPTEELKSA